MADYVLELELVEREASAEKAAWLAAARTYKERFGCRSCNHALAAHVESGCLVPQEVWSGAGYRAVKCGCGAASRRPAIKARPATRQAGFGDLFDDEEAE